MNVRGNSWRLTAQAKKSWRDAGYPDLRRTAQLKKSWRAVGCCKYSSRGRKFEVIHRCIREIEVGCFLAAGVVTGLFFRVVPPVRSPNKAPEPTA